MERKGKNCHMFLRMVRELKLSRDWFGSTLVINFNISKMFTGTVTQSAASFNDVNFFQKAQVIQ